MESIENAPSSSDHRRTIHYLRRKARSIELQAAHAAPTVAAQLRSLAVSLLMEVEELERAGTL